MQMIMLSEQEWNHELRSHEMKHRTYKKYVQYIQDTLSFDEEDLVWTIDGNKLQKWDEDYAKPKNPHMWLPPTNAQLTTYQLTPIEAESLKIGDVVCINAHDETIIIIDVFLASLDPTGTKHSERCKTISAHGNIRFYWIDDLTLASPAETAEFFTITFYFLGLT